MQKRLAIGQVVKIQRTPSPVFNSLLTLEALRGAKLTPSIFFGFKFMLLDRLSKALAQLFLVC